MNGDLLDSNFRTFINLEGDCDGVWRNVFRRSFDGGVLVALLGQHHLDDRFGFLDLAGIVIGFLRDRRLLLFQLIEDFRIGN